MANYREEEMKLFVADLGAVARQLEAAGAKLTGPRVYERNVRYDDDSHALTSLGIVVRLRQDTRVRLTYKEGGETSDTDVLSRFEAEVQVSDFDGMDTILKKLGLQPYMIYEKYRTTYKLDDLEIVLDEMPYGNFVEIEGEAGKIDPLREQLGLRDAPNFHAGYVALFERIRRRLGLDFTDLTFDNFKGIKVTRQAFEE